MIARPRLSVVVPTCRRVDRLAVLLEHLRPGQQTLEPAAYEVVVSDDDQAGSARRALGKRFSDVRFVDGPGRGPAANRNHLARCALGDWLVFIDDDCRPANGWLRAVSDIVTSASPEVVEGKIVAPEKHDSILRRHVENLTGDCFWSANLAIRRDVFERIGGFDEDFLEAGGEDLELAHRFRQWGIRTVFCPEALVYHPSHVLTWWAVIKWAFTIRWHALYLLKTGQTVPARAPLWLAVPHVAGTRIATLLRTTVRPVRFTGPSQPPARLSEIALNWVLFPVILPYVVCWDIRFRRMLRRRTAGQAKTAARANASM
jgi:GT2 family glycosyltransferase